jgi:hypothetical protein
MSGKTGFGIGGVLPPPDISQDQMRAAAGDHTTLLKLIEKHTRDLADKYVEQPLEQPNVIQIVGSATAYFQRLDLSTQPHNSFIICVFAGTLNLWVGDYGNPAQSAVPNWGTYAAGANIQYFLTLRGRVYTIVNPSTTVTLQASFIPIAN